MLWLLLFAGSAVLAGCGEDGLPFSLRDPAVRDTGVFLFNTERTAVEEYWLDVSGTNFPEAFPRVALGMVWGGKGVFETWFSADVDCIHGINWLPFTPASILIAWNGASLISPSVA